MNLKNSLKNSKLSIDDIKANYSGQEIDTVGFEEDKENGKLYIKL